MLIPALLLPVVLVGVILVIAAHTGHRPGINCLRRHHLHKQFALDELQLEGLKKLESAASVIGKSMPAHRRIFWTRRMDCSLKKLAARRGDFDSTWKHFVLWVLTDPQYGLGRFTSNDSERQELLDVESLYANGWTDWHRWHNLPASSAAVPSAARALCADQLCDRVRAAGCFAAAAARTSAERGGNSTANELRKQSEKLAELVAAA